MPPGSNTRFLIGATLPISVTCPIIGFVRDIQFGPGLKSIQTKARSSRTSLLPSRGPAVGGGIRGGQVYGSSDAQAACPKSNPVSPEDVIATTYHALGISPESLIHDRENRPHKISDGRPRHPCPEPVPPGPLDLVSIRSRGAAVCS
jgi:hypothetical protein